MEFLEVLLVLIFIVVPLLEGVFRQRKKGGGENVPLPEPQRQEAERVGAGAGAGSRSRSGPEDQGAAADMVPADLWEILTGEKRTAPEEDAPPPPQEETFGVEAMSAEFPEEIGSEEAWAPAPWEEEPSRVEDWSEAPVTLEYDGPEVYTLETEPLPPEERHRRFHEKYDTVLEPVRRPSARTAGLRAGLRGSGLRRSVLLAEILGPPKGLA